MLFLFVIYIFSFFFCPHPENRLMITELGDSLIFIFVLITGEGISGIFWVVIYYNFYFLIDFSILDHAIWFILIKFLAIHNLIKNYCLRIEQKLKAHLEMHTHDVLSLPALTEEGKTKLLVTLKFIENYMMPWTKKESCGVSELTVLLLDKEFLPVNY